MISLCSLYNMDIVWLLLQLTEHEQTFAFSHIRDHQRAETAQLRFFNLPKRNIRQRLADEPVFIDSHWNESKSRMKLLSVSFKSIAQISFRRVPHDGTHGNCIFGQRGTRERLHGSRFRCRFRCRPAGLPVAGTDRRT